MAVKARGSFQREDFRQPPSLMAGAVLLVLRAMGKNYFWCLFKMQVGPNSLF